MSLSWHKWHDEISSGLRQGVTDRRTDEQLNFKCVLKRDERTYAWRMDGRKDISAFMLGLGFYECFYYAKK